MILLTNHVMFGKFTALCGVVVLVVMTLDDGFGSLARGRAYWHTMLGKYIYTNYTRSLHPVEFRYLKSASEIFVRMLVSERLTGSRATCFLGALLLLTLLLLFL